MLRWPDSTVYQAIASIARENPDQPAFLGNDTELTYGDLIETSRELATDFQRRGVTAGERIAIWLGNRPEWLVVHLAAAALGASVVAVNTRYRAHELEYMLKDAAVSVLVTETAFLGRDYLETIADVVPSVTTEGPGEIDCAELPALNYVVTIDPTRDHTRAVPLAEFTSSDATPSLEPPASDPTDPAVVFYTSGTTSDPKGCLQSHRSLVNHSYQVGEFLGVSSTDIALGALPFCGVMGYNTVLSALTHGIPVIAQSHFDPEVSIRLIEKHSVTYFSAIGEMYLRIIDQAAFTPDRVSSLEKGAVAFVGTVESDTAVDRIETAVEFPIVQPYGLSEANSQVFMGRPDDALDQRKRVGGPLIHPEEVSAKVIDPETGAERVPGDEGELCLQGYFVMNEYLGKPEATARAFDDGWLRTGDLCVQDTNGYLYFHGRLDDAIRVRGFLVAPGEIEAVITAQPGVGMAQVVGVPHPRHGEVPVAFVHREDDSVSEAEVQRNLSGEIADYKVPERVVFVDEFPRTDGPHGRKIQKHLLRERVADLFV